MRTKINDLVRVYDMANGSLLPPLPEKYVVPMMENMGTLSLLRFLATERTPSRQGLRSLAGECLRERFANHPIHSRQGGNDLDGYGCREGRHVRDMWKEEHTVRTAALFAEYGSRRALRAVCRNDEEWKALYDLCPPLQRMILMDKLRLSPLPFPEPRDLLYSIACRMELDDDALDGVTWFGEKGRIRPYPSLLDANNINWLLSLYVRMGFSFFVNELVYRNRLLVDAYSQDEEYLAIPPATEGSLDRESVRKAVAVMMKHLPGVLPKGFQKISYMWYFLD
jgi:hypothetical protein